ncbi:hypothetical protein ACLQ2S_22970 [Micromonospora sp. DT48]|uniref:hypothetical protein n=1 Tax=unclassified Micromonospora TaxID=2617518 RepID=UPI0013235979|nr:hypothetical protein [Micromonospora sp. CP22]MTK03061.1 hypothetical protein [Micromonospora sp. CP22]
MTASATTAHDPRCRDDGLGWVTRAVFADSRVAVVVDGDPPPGHTVTARYAIVPSVSRARFLLPMGSPRVAAAALLSYNALRPAKLRAARAVLGMAARVGAVDRAPFPVLTVAVPAGVDPAEVLLAERVGAELGVPVHAACGVRPPDPNHKPTLQLFDSRGEPRGYAKIGWNAATRALVTAEAAALREVAGLAGTAGHPGTTRLLTEFSWGGQAVAVVEPLPARIRGVPVDTEPDLAALLAVARRGRPAAAARPLAGSPFLARLTDEARRAATDVGDRASAAVADLARRHANVTVEFGHWHGDWVPWNLGRHGGDLIAWDWEHSGPDVPVGFDLAHDAFQRALVLRGEPAAEAARQVDTWLLRHGDALGLDRARQRLVADAYLLEMWLRTWRLANAGAGWNPALHPALLDTIQARHT